MDDRLQRVSDQRFVHLLRSDAPRVAQAIVDKMLGRARVTTGRSGNVGYVEFVYPGVYSVIIRTDDWRKIFPIIFYGSAPFTPMFPPSAPPAPVLSLQPNKLVGPFVENPGVGFRSFLEGFTWDEYKQLQQLLTISNVGREPASLSYRAFQALPDPVSINPATRRTDQSGMSDVYDRLVGILQELFPRDYPTSEV